LVFDLVEKIERSNNGLLKGGGVELPAKDREKERKKECAINELKLLVMKMG
jgi:hypothetical protein